MHANRKTTIFGKRKIHPGKMDVKAEIDNFRVFDPSSIFLNTASEKTREEIDDLLPRSVGQVYSTSVTLPSLKVTFMPP